MDELQKLSKEIHQTAVEHGWWDAEVATSALEKLALIHSEVSEALEAWRIDDIEIRIEDSGKPEGFAVELADAIIRILDLTMSMGLNMDEAVRVKMEYNKTRPFRHGGKRA